MLDNPVKVYPSGPVFDGERPEYVPSKPVRRLDTHVSKPKTSWADLLGEKKPMDTKPTFVHQQNHVSSTSEFAKNAPPLPKPDTFQYRVLSHIDQLQKPISFTDLLSALGGKRAYFRENLRKMVSGGRLLNLTPDSPIPESIFDIPDAYRGKLIPAENDLPATEAHSQQDLMQESPHEPQPDVPDTANQCKCDSEEAPTCDSVPAYSLAEDVFKTIQNKLHEIDIISKEIRNLALRTERFREEIQTLLDPQHVA